MSVITIRSMTFETVYDNAEQISAPVLCHESKPTINNINLSGLKTLIAKNPNGIWSDESLNDFKDLLENEPSDKIFVTVGEIILSPKNNPDVYYLFKQEQNKNGKTYLFIEKLKRSSSKKKRAQKVISKKQTKKSVEQQPLIETPSITVETPKKSKTPSKVSSKTHVKKEKKEEDTPINAECFFMMKMAEALMEYVKLTYPDDLKKYKKIKR